MTRLVQRAVTLLVATAVSVLVIVTGGGAAASAAEPCGLNMVWAGNTGEVYASLAPNGFVQWGARS